MILWSLDSLANITSTPQWCIMIDNNSIICTKWCIIITNIWGLLRNDIVADAGLSYYVIRKGKEGVFITLQ